MNVMVAQDEMKAIAAAGKDAPWPPESSSRPDELVWATPYGHYVRRGTTWHMIEPHPGATRVGTLTLADVPRS